MAKGYRQYKGDPYWIGESPETADAGKLRATYYQNAGKLHLSVLYRAFEGGIKIGKTIVIDEKVFKENPMFGELINKVFREWQ